MKRHREGKLTLRTYKVEPTPLPKVDSKLIRDTRRKLPISPAPFSPANYASTSAPWKNGSKAAPAKPTSRSSSAPSAQISNHLSPPQTPNFSYRRTNVSDFLS